MSSDCTSIDILTQDLITLILLKLPVKPLLICKSVCKHWLSLISNPNFILSHLKHAEGGADQTFIAYEQGDNSMFVLNLDSPQIKAPLAFPYSRGDYSFEPHYRTVGCFNGIVCVSVSNCPRKEPWDDFDFEWYDGNIEYLNNPSTYLWNPATKHSRLIPPHFIARNVMSVAVGFGFDPIGDDFKVLRVVTSGDGSFSSQVYSAEVYSANTNVWRKVVPRLTDYPQYDKFDVCVHGFMCCEGSRGMMAFDLHKEVFTYALQFPVICFDYFITDFDDSIAIITSEAEELNHIFKLWTLNDESCLHGGVEASWTLMLTVDVDFTYPQLFGFLNNRDFLLFTNDDVCLLYNCHKKEARTVPVSIIFGRKIIKYNESLISITGSKYVDWNAREDDN